jgi:hypothetical protein
MKDSHYQIRHLVIALTASTGPNGPEWRCPFAPWIARDTKTQDCGFGGHLI